MRYKLVEDLHAIVVVSIIPEAFREWLSKDIGQNIATRFDLEMGFINNRQLPMTEVTGL